ncbi:MAG: hypothetical protein LBM00_10985 [Deltaproteobacteria bacterium]|nr:hypothetical protein [Deltaproteobacteria bacterium]
MYSLQKNKLLWSFGLSPEQEKNLRGTLNEEYSLHSWAAEAVPDLADFDAEKPSLHIFSVEGYKAYREQRNNPVSTLDILPQVMLLPENASAETLQYAIDSDCMAILRSNLAPECLIRKIEHILEVSEMQNSLLRITNEIFLEREIYERKNSVLHFLVDFLSGIYRQPDIEKIIPATFSCLKTLFPIRSLHMALWEQNAGAPAQLFITAAKNSGSFSQWHALLLKQIKPALSGCPREAYAHNLHLADQETTWRNATPADGYVLHLPLFLAETQIGLLSILTDMERSITRDQAQALNAAMQFLALAVHKISGDKARLVPAMGL